MVEALAHDALHVSPPLSTKHYNENLSQQEEEIQGLQAICGSDCISCLNQAGSSSKLEPLKATLLINADLPEGQLRLTIRGAALGSETGACYDDSILCLQQLIGRSGISNGNPDSSKQQSTVTIRPDVVGQSPADRIFGSNRYTTVAGSTPSSAEDGHATDEAGPGSNCCPAEPQADLPSVTSLPPLHLRLTFPLQYPFASPPAASISAAWLTQQQAQSLEDHLYQIWNDQGPGLPVCFSWLEWLQACSLEHLGITSTLSLLPLAASQINSSSSQPDLPHEPLAREAFTPVDSADVSSQSISTRPVHATSNASERQLQCIIYQPSLLPTPADTSASEVPASTAPHSNGHNNPAPHVCSQASRSLPQNGKRETFLADDGQGAHFSAAEVFAEADMLLGHLLRYDAMREWDRWAQGVWPCGICLEEVPGSKCARLGCRHAFCTSCMQAHCRLHIKEGSLDQLRCPVPDCKRPFEPQAMAELLNEDEVRRWQTLEDQRMFERSGRAAYCPRCSAMCLEADDGSNCAQCPRCYFAFCTQCQDSWHPASQPCLSPEVALQALKLRMQGMQASASELKQRENEFLSLKAIQKSSKQCPTCKMAIQKAAGCSHMICGSCGTHFCWRCNKSIDGYEHFRGGACILFDDGEIRAWEMQMARLTQAQHDREMAMMRNDFWRHNGGGQQRVRPQLCPRCGQPNYKQANNNSITCPSCTCRFCFLCRTILLRGTRHFSGTGGCKQHS
ncbi:hypothetical protein WJX74_008697 [Apatococcus lobatus]|uniref:RBR-type E3 ubiquitin transferase n=1 Tax=Apatococcus lobatus TaxID=904363 RepID=A0AAW1SG93_9CHLO